MPKEKRRKIAPLVHQARSFPALIAARPKALILGSMPGLTSLAEGQYYAHPRNAFWPILSSIFQLPVENYTQRRQLIKASRLALWDVLAFCKRQGSLDAQIRDHTIRVNDIPGLLDSYPGIRHIFCNGGKAGQEFKKRILPRLAPPVAARLSIQILPSTSPAHAARRFDDKLSIWSEAMADAGLGLSG